MVSTKQFQEVVQETMAQTDALIRRVMKCTSPDDPNVGDVICNDDDLQLALFISKSLTKAIMCYNHQQACSVISTSKNEFSSCHYVILGWKKGRSSNDKLGIFKY